MTGYDLPDRLRKIKDATEKCKHANSIVTLFI